MAWQGTIIDMGGRLGISIHDGNVLELDTLIPGGQTGKLIWIQENVGKNKKRV